MLKRLLSFFTVISIIGLNTIPVLAASCEKTVAVEHLDVHKKAPCNVVTITNLRKTVEKGNVLQFVFDEKFFSKCAQAGQIVHFVVPQAL